MPAWLGVADVRVRGVTAAPPTAKDIPSGSTLLDLLLGGGWPIGRVVNVVGDRSSGKTLLAIEAAANFSARGGNVFYVEAESAFDRAYAESLGFPADAQLVQNIRTVEDFYAHISGIADARKSSTVPVLYVLDSLDALSDDAEMERPIDEGSYGAAKAKKLSEAFRRLAALLEQTRITLMVISQVRDKIGVTFGDTKTRSGGRALDFYASIILWLSEIKKTEQTIRGQKRVTGVQVRAKTKKNKVALPFREVEFEIRFGWGVDDESSCVRYLESLNLTELPDGTMLRGLPAKTRSLRAADPAQATALLSMLAQECARHWFAIEDAFRPPGRKYV